MPSTYTKIYAFVQDLAQGLHVIKTSAGNDYRLGLTNGTPTASDATFNTSTLALSSSAATELTTGGGYTQGGTSIGNPTTASQTTGTFTFAANQVVWTSTGTIGPFRYVFMFNNSTGSATARPMVAFWDYGSGISLANGESLTVQFNSSNPGTVFTLA